MKKTILNLVGVQKLSKNEQKIIHGGKKQCDYNNDGICEEFGLQCAETRCRFIID